MNDLGIIKKALSGSLQPCSNPESPAEWAYLGFFIGFRLFKMIRPWRLKTALLLKEDKSDGSPATDLEGNAETFAKQSLLAFYPNTGFQGEESGATDTHHVFQLVIDPIDGTRSFLSGFDTFSITVGIIKEKDPVFSLIINPSSGDFAFRIKGKQSKIFQYPLFPEEIAMVGLPNLSGKDAPILVNVHPSISARPYLEELHTLWKSKQIALVKSVSGSPALQILEAARGGSLYFNNWYEGETMPYDLLVPLDIIQGAGGQILNKMGDPIDPWNHRGRFLAGVNLQSLHWLYQTLKDI